MEMRIWVTSLITLPRGWKVCARIVGGTNVCSQYVDPDKLLVVDDNGSIYFVDSYDESNVKYYGTYIHHKGVNWHFNANIFNQIVMAGSNGEIIAEEGCSSNRYAHPVLRCGLIIDDDNLSTVLVLHENRIIRLSIEW